MNQPSSGPSHDHSWVNQFRAIGTLARGFRVVSDGPAGRARHRPVAARRALLCAAGPRLAPRPDPVDVRVVRVELGGVCGDIWRKFVGNLEAF